MNPRTLVAACLAACALASTAALADPATPAAEFTLAASNWKFTPGTITAHPGQTVVLHAKAAEGMHGLVSDQLGIRATTLAPGKTVDVTFVAPSKPGKYYVHCSVPCGPGHASMVLEVDVQ
jgi:cytochrome c oxidase subunit II